MNSDVRVLAVVLPLLHCNKSAYLCDVAWLLQSQAARPQGASEVQMVAAVSQATRAAAEAATAAAGAAAICIIDPRDGPRRDINGRRPARRRRYKPVTTSDSEDDMPSGHEEASSKPA